MAQRAIQSFAFDMDGMNTVVNEDDLYEDDHPLVVEEEKRARKAGRPSLFRDVLDDPLIIKAPAKKSRVEQATAAPGEKRAVRKP